MGLHLEAIVQILLVMKILKLKTVFAFPGKYIDILKKGKSIFTGNFDNKIEKFKIKEIEVFKPFK